MQVQTIIHVLLLISATAGLVMTVFVYLADPKSWFNRMLAMIMVLADIWGLSIFVTVLKGNIAVGNLSFFAVIWILILVNLVLLNISGKITKKLIIQTIRPGAIFSLILFIPNLLVKQIDTTQGFIKIVEIGPFYYVYAIAIIGYLGLFAYNAYQAVKNTIDMKRMQVLYIIGGFIITSIFGLIFSLILPSIGIFQFNTLGPIFMLFAIAGSAYAATKHYIYGSQVILSELWVFLLIVTSLIWLIINLSTFNIIFFLILMVISLLFIRTTISEAVKKKQLENDRDALQKLDKLKDNFQQMTEHELNTPIGIIEGKLSMILNENFGGFSEKQKEYLKPVFADARRLAKLSRELADVSDIDQGEVRLFRENLDITDLIVDVVSFNRESAKAKGLKIEINAPQNLPKVSIDHDKIKRVLTNLIENAVKFTSTGIIKVVVSQEKNQLVVSVSDTGIGIKKEDQEKIFSKFYQADRFSETPLEQQGTGLSMYVAKNLIEYHGGKITVDSTPGIGSTFSFNLLLNNH
jgi:signal transduction histidine kinase